MRAVGRASATNRLGAVAPSERANRVSYARNGVSEWWENGPIGLEQNFQIAQRPAGTRALTLSLAITGPIALAHGELSLAGGLRYAGLRANDANGHPLPAWFELHHGRALIRVNDHGARYPIHIDPFVQQAETTASDATSSTGLATRSRSRGTGRRRLSLPELRERCGPRGGVRVRDAGGWLAD